MINYVDPNFDTVSLEPNFDIVGKLKRNHPPEPIEATVLGKKVDSPDQYDPSVLVAVPRSQNRDIHKIDGSKFEGNDLWRCYECSTLTIYGMPVYFQMDIQYPSNSPNIVESKSLKLYLNSFNMTKSPFATVDATKRWYMETVRNDLKTVLDVTPSISGGGWRLSCSRMKDYTNITDIVDYSLVYSEGYNVENSLLKRSAAIDCKRLLLRFDGFRSNCKITNQPDFATVFIKISAEEGVDPVGIAKYLTSYRNENHFHEECCELIYKDLVEKLFPKELSVTCSYTRRGGIDITPTRYLVEPKHEGILGGTSYYLVGGVTSGPVEFMPTIERTEWQ